ncbi:restriction endonuclease subunit S, partial [Escherichia coli]|nr:restriction endonuclease subunit S [Escherichia coli]ELM5194691.1 restriction endonuclease subunit S [Escherichia coli]
PRLGTEKAQQAVIELAPIQEQLRIVSRVDKLMSLCDQLEQQSLTSLDAHQQLVETLLGTLTDSQNAEELAENWARINEHFDTLFTTEASVDALKQTILQLAVMGKLVPQDPNDEPASELLKRIAQEKAQLVKEGKIKKQKLISAICNKNTYPALPSTWEWARLIDLVYLITDGAHHTPTYTQAGIPFISVKDISSGSINFNETKFISHEQHKELIKRCHPQRGDLLLTKIGTTGIPVIIDTDKEFSIFVSVALIKFPNHLINPNYLKLLISSPFVKKQSEEGTQGVGNKNLVLKTISMFTLMIPPFEEQARIVDQVERMHVYCDKLINYIKSAQQTQLHLADALTDAAVN